MRKDESMKPSNFRSNCRDCVMCGIAPDFVYFTVRRMTKKLVCFLIEHILLVV